MPLLTNAKYLGLGRRIARLLGAALEGLSAEALRELARAYDPAANEARISAEVFLFHKFLLMQACVGVFPETEVDHVVGGLCAALNERAGELELSLDRQQAMEQVWQLRAGQFDGPFARDRAHVLDQGSGPVYWRETIGRFCQNVRQFEDPPDIWTGADGPSHLASRAVTAELDRMVSALGELNRIHFSGAA
ncbi:MAG: hypothetical protein ACT4O4_12725 [Nitrospiraceae bacterium]